MNLVLTGFMGTGKTAVGQRIAKALKVPFIDTDTMIEAVAGRSISEIFASEGEAAFRKLEKSIIETISSRDQVVIATGGGALIDEENRRKLQHHGFFVWLTARVETLLKRLKDDGSRPLLVSIDRRWHIEQLMKQREKYYADCPLRVRTDGQSVTDVARKIMGKLPRRWHGKLPPGEQA